MAGEPRVWVDIDRDWLKSYLQEQELASDFDLDDDLIGSQVSWILNADEWARLRGAWEARQRAGSARYDIAPEPPPESADAGPAEAAEPNTAESAEDLPDAATGRVEQLDEAGRIDDLTQKALGDWGAFRELFRNCPEITGIGVWETFANSPAALLNRAGELIAAQQARTEAQNQQTQRAFEGDVNRAQNIIAGYHIYCRKHRISPTLGHMLEYIPEMRTGHSPEAVEEAWRREAEHQ